uniref:Tetratricopeptide repeat-containing protein n=1 Tax=Candidatus Kentrum sp. MB TaxID=2138164 RepID=A0A450XIL7_9GAMM|nr:MAG: Tetratricopeptide repeat-containing protein [Candidatus Kentron sp. MB]VFK30922.1 MAG: Tetratricopeptide repeat-containing protein [Candidatus Kentron sp. MB]VFK75738.1 MAG: Tetratricopeptide repeat-containing protein [Candidatus Kentron sp. MB]
MIFYNRNDGGLDTLRLFPNMGNAFSLIILRRYFHTRSILPLCFVTIIYLAVSFIALISPRAIAASSCQSLEFLCVLGLRDSHTFDYEMTLAEIKALADKGDFDSAFKGIEQFLKKNPNHVEGRLLSGVFSIWRGEPDRAIDIFRALAHDHPDLAEPYNNLAVIHAANKRYEQAEDALEKALSINPRQGVVWENLGDIYARYADSLYERAKKLYISKDKDKDKEAGNVTANIETELEKKSAAIKKIVRRLGDAPDTRETISPTEIDVYRVATTRNPNHTRVVSLFESPNDHQIVETTLPAETDISGATEDDPNDVPPAVESPHRPVCYLALSDRKNLPAITKWFEENNISTSTHTYDTQRPHGYEVVVSPSGDHGDLPALLEKMKTDGIRGIRNTTLVYQGNFQHSVIVGVFETENAAKRRIDELWEKGYEAQYRPGFGIGKQYRIKVHPAPDSTLNEEAFVRRFPAVVLQTTPCE